MSEPLSYQKIEDGIRECINQLDRLLHELAELGDDLAEKKSAYKVGFAQARVRARTLQVAGRKPTIDQVDDAATLDTDQLYLDMELAQARYNAIKTAEAGVRARMDAMRSLMASHRAQT
jgi:hypothetical protein